MKKYIILTHSKTSNHLGTLRGEILWNSLREADDQIKYQMKLHNARVKVSNEHFGNDTGNIAFPECRVVSIEIPSVFIK